MGLRFTHIFLSFILASVTGACSSSKWVVVDQKATDRNDFELLETEYFLTETGQITPNSPFAYYELKAANTFEYAQRVQTDRYIQRYSPSFQSVLFGLLGAGLASTSAIIVDDLSSGDNTQIVQGALYGTAGFVVLASFLNMNPKGQATATGETRLLRRTGSIQETDTVSTEPLPELVPTYTIYDSQDILAIGNDIPFVNGRYTINLLEGLIPENFEYGTDESITLEVIYDNDIYTQEIPLESIFERFVVVSSEVTALRDEPVLDTRTILTDLAQGSQMKLIEENEFWYKVSYGISETFISKSDAYLIWRPSEFVSQLSIITIPNIPFGNVDVESGIPVLSERNDDSFAFLLANREYQGEVSERPYAERDARLVEEYLQTSYGIPPENLIKTVNVESQQQMVLAYNRFANLVRSDKKQVVVYVSGYVESGEDDQVFLFGTNDGTDLERINLNSFFSGISRLPVEELVVFLDLDNIEEESNQINIKLADQIQANNPNSAIIFSSSETQRSRNYSTPNGDQKRHSIFTYFLADAIKNGATTVSEIVSYLQRNVDYTSRRLHDTPQQILFVGNPDIRLVK